MSRAKETRLALLLIEAQHLWHKSILVLRWATLTSAVPDSCYIDCVQRSNMSYPACDAH